MDGPERPTFRRRIRRAIFGGARSPTHPETFHKISLIAFFAWVGLGADGLSSSCYGPAEAFIALHHHPYLGLFVALASALTIFVISTSYSQIIELFPAGGGGYVVASKLLSPTVGMVAGCALLVDYVLTIAVSIASGVDAIFSFLPPAAIQYRLTTQIFMIVLLAFANLRGVKETVRSLVPIFLAFVGLHLFVIGYAFSSHATDIGSVFRTAAADAEITKSELGLLGMIFLVMHAYSMGAGTYTGIEAVSNGLPLLREPRVQTGKRVMTYMWISLAVLVVGLMVSYLLFQVEPEENKTLNAVLLERMTLNWGGPGKGFVLATLLVEAVLLMVAAQTGFLGGPRMLAYMARDRWMPSRLSLLSDRLVTQNGVLIMAAAAFVTMYATGGSVRYLVILYSINVFITFLLSQTGMVKHWWTVRRRGRRWGYGLLVNGTGAVLTLFILTWITVSKFEEGGWVTLLITGSLIVLVSLIRRHYNSIRPMMARLNKLTELLQLARNQLQQGAQAGKPPEFDPNGKTAVVLVNGFNGFGMHTLLNVLRFFGESFRNFIFVQVGIVDAGNFKGIQEMANLQKHIVEQASRYVEFVGHNGYFGQAVTRVGTDVVDELENMAPGIVKTYPGAVFFAGQLVFPSDNLLTRILHNNITFATQRRLYRMGIPFVILPIRV